MLHSLCHWLARLRRRPPLQARRRAGAPRIEALEDRSVPSCATIGGSVYEDLNNNGIREAGEPGIANNPVELRDTATGALVASATTDANGNYEFATDGRIDTATETLTREAVIAPTTTNGALSVEIEQFDSALGTLESVDIILDGTIVSQVKVESLDASATTVTAQVAGSFTLSAPGGAALVVNLSNEDSAVLDPFDGQANFQGTSSHDFGPKTGTGSETLTLAAGNPGLGAYVGTGRVTLSGTGTATSSVNGSGNLMSQVSTTVSGRVQIVYRYTPNNCIQPGSYYVHQRNQPASYLDGQNTNDNVQPLAGSVGVYDIPVVLSGDSSPNNNFGELRLASVAGFVFLDANDDGTFESGELPIPGVTVRLTDGATGQERQAVTADDGSYAFNDLTPGSYALSEVQPDGYVDGKEQMGSLGGALGLDQFFIQLGSSQHGQTYNFGELLPSQPPPPPPPPDTGDPGDPVIPGVPPPARSSISKLMLIGYDGLR